MSKIAIYARVSTEKQEKQETIKSQLSALREFAKDNKHTVVKEYIDDGYSGELLDRPALDNLRDDSKKKLFEAVLIHSPDRLSRKYIYAGLVQEELRKSGANIIFLNRPDSKDTPEDNLMDGMQGLFAEFEKEKIKERTRRGRLEKAKSGLIVTSQAPYGYKYIREDKINKIVGHYKIVKAEAKVVKLIFDLLVNKNLSIRAIARELTKRSISPQRGKNWQTSSLHRIIRNETYMGLAHYNKHMGCEPKEPKNIGYRRHKNTSMKVRPREQWIAIELPKELIIIDKRTFERARKQLAINSNMSSRNVKNKYLLRRLVKCGACGSHMYGDPCKGTLYYRCGNRSKTFPLPRECKALTVRAENIEDVVWNSFCEAICDPRLITRQIPKLKDKSSRAKDQAVKEIEAIEREISGFKTEESRLLDAYREGILSMDQLKDQMKKIKDNKARIEQERDQLRDQQEPATSKASTERSIKGFCAQIESRLDDLKDDFEGRRYLLTLALNSVILDGKNVRIKGIIPTNPPERSIPDGHIASTGAGCCERNAVFEYELTAVLT